VDVPESPSVAAMTLRNGERLEGVLVKGEGEGIGISIPECGLVRVPFEHVAGIYFWGASRDLAKERAAQDEFSNYAGRLDQILTTSGDALTGILAAMGPTEAIIEREGRQVSVPTETISKVLFARTKDFQLFRQWHSRVLTTYGNRLAIVPIAITAGALKGRFLFGGDCIVKLDQVRNVTFRYGAAIYLAEITPSRVEEKPFFVTKWPYRVNNSVGGKPLTVARRRFETGFGTHSYCRLEFDLSEPYSFFAAQVGIDDETQGLGSIDFVVLVDGVEKFRSSVAKPGAIVEVKVDLSGAKVLALVTDYGGDDDIGDSGDWLEPKLVKPKGKQPDKP
ncbi:MAG: NPCBM/NEW2 domain-containing protein, partial [Candidatus Brocadiia bacterium]